MRKLAALPIEPGAPSIWLDSFPVLVVPGWNGSGPGHWQTIWENEHPQFRRVEQANWTRPPRDEWLDQIDVTVRSLVHFIDRPAFVVAHSLGCLAVANWAAEASEHQKERIAGAFLVAPPWLTQSEQCPKELSDFSPMPLCRLPFAAMLVASENDPYLPIELAARLAVTWQAQFVNVGGQGHINVASGHGPWELGKQLLRRFMTDTAREP